MEPKPFLEKFNGFVDKCQYLSAYKELEKNAPFELDILKELQLGFEVKIKEELLDNCIEYTHKIEGGWRTDYSNKAIKEISLLRDFASLLGTDISKEIGKLKKIYEKDYGKVGRNIISVIEDAYVELLQEARLTCSSYRFIDNAEEILGNGVNLLKGFSNLLDVDNKSAIGYLQNLTSLKPTKGEMLARSREKLQEVGLRIGNLEKLAQTTKPEGWQEEGVMEIFKQIELDYPLKIYRAEKKRLEANITELESLIDIASL